MVAATAAAAAVAAAAAAAAVTATAGLQPQPWSIQQTAGQLQFRQGTRSRVGQIGSLALCGKRQCRLMQTPGVP